MIDLRLANHWRRMLGRAPWMASVLSRQDRARRPAIGKGQPVQIVEQAGPGLRRKAHDGQRAQMRPPKPRLEAAGQILIDEDGVQMHRRLGHAHALAACGGKVERHRVTKQVTKERDRNMLGRRKFNLAMLATVATVALGGLGSGAMAADEPTIGVIVPTLDLEFWNRYVAFTKTGAEAAWRETHRPERRQQAGSDTQFTQDLVARKVDGII